MRFGILGPLRIRVGDADTTLAAGRERTVLALLLLHPDKVVPVERLAEAVWGADPPSTVRAQVHNCVSRLRRALRQKGITEEVLLTDPAGYRVMVGPDDLDSLVFARHVREGRVAAAAGRLTDARTRLRQALGLWRGPALAGVVGLSVETGAAALEEQRSAAFEDCAEVELRLGLAHELVGELTDLVHRYPLRERLRGQLMLALYRVGRQADALAVYRRGWQALAEELGLEPGPELQQLHRRILNRDPGLLGEAPEPVVAAPPRLCLPRDLADFTAREATLARLQALVPSDPRTGPAIPVIQVIDGMPGTGKTSLAVHLAHLVGSRYPDAQLFIDLHGHSDQAPVDPATALDALLRQLGVPAERIGERRDERVGLWRSELAARQALVVPDNAADSAKVAPLLPGGSRTLVIVTSRRRLSGLDGVHHVSLDPLDAAESVRLLARIAGDRVALEPAAADEVARLCGNLPLALRLVAARLAHRPSWTVADLADRLRRARAPLAELAVDGRTVSAAFALSYQQLEEQARHVFRFLGLHPSGSFDRRAAAALTDLDPDAGHDVLEGLVDAHLLESPSAHRYRLHDLMHSYARDLAVVGEREAATGRMLTYYLAATARATGFLEPGYARTGLDFPSDPGALAEISGEEEALSWLAEERENVVACIRLAAGTGRHRLVCSLTRALWVYLWSHGHSDELIETHQLALASAGELGDEAAVATVHNYLASGYARQGRWPAAIEHLHRALDIRRRQGDVPGQVATLGNLGLAYQTEGRYREAVDHVLQALSIAERHRLAEAAIRARAALGNVYMLLGRYPEALAQHRAHLAISRELGNRYQQAIALGDLGAVHMRMGHHRVAVALLKRAADNKRAVGNRYGTADTLADLGCAYRELGRHAEAVARLREALDLMQSVGDRFGECRVLNDLGTTLRVTGDTAEAEELHQLALGLADRGRHRYQQARAHDGAAAACVARDPALAREHWSRALALYRELGVPEADTVLADLGVVGVS